MGKLFKIYLSEEDDLFRGYHQKKLYQHLQTRSKLKLKQFKKQKKKLKKKYFCGDFEDESSILPKELNAKLCYFYELNKCAQSLSNYDGTDDVKSSGSEQKKKYFTFGDYCNVLNEIGNNANCRNYKIFQREFEEELEATKSSGCGHRECEIYVCIRCGMELTAKHLIMDQNFHGRTGPSFLIQSVFNIDIGAKATRKLHTGMHVVSDVFCKKCSTNIGWYYHEATKPDQQYKISHFVVECALICPRRQYELHNYHISNDFVPNLKFDQSKNVPRILPKYMSLNHRSFDNVHPENLRCDEKANEKNENVQKRKRSKVRDKKKKKIKKMENESEERQRNVTFADDMDNDEDEEEEDDDDDDDDEEQIETQSLSESESDEQSDDEEEEEEEEFDVD